MQCSRRDTIALLSSTALLGTAGCMQGSSDEPETNGTAGESGTAATADGSEQTPASALFATVSGPDGEQTFFQKDTVANVGDVREQPDSDGYELAATLTDGGTDSASEALQATGAAEAPDDATITVTVDGEEASTYAVAPSLAESVTEDDWDGLLLMQFEDEETAKTVKTKIEES
ncbi:hypothetical protein SAMN05216559_0581 [Halomicrobium zhouii]|uniref:Uncharacterized protein n=1 Tax=Halomicrobium zhouii TaxID=767519 RepID=A0A1I6KD60_9EURY|nr:hypothetical protein [Halomicrobium zhouii]SFR89126.1 hypothetical protein SAMN05216559_0581 [Halomicrobium zhouii]